MIVRFHPVGCRILRWNRASKLALPQPPPGHSAGGLPAHPAERRRSRCLACGRVVEAEYSECLPKIAAEFSNRLGFGTRFREKFQLVLIRKTLICDFRIMTTYFRVILSDKSEQTHVV
jgi:hypothetical protein